MLIQAQEEVELDSAIAANTNENEAQMMMSIQIPPTQGGAVPEEIKSSNPITH